VGADGKTPNEACCACGGGFNPASAFDFSDADHGMVADSASDSLPIEPLPVSPMPSSPPSAHPSISSAPISQQSVSSEDVGDATVNKQSTTSKTEENLVKEPNNTREVDHSLNNDQTSGSVRWGGQALGVTVAASVALVVGFY